MRLCDVLERINLVNVHGELPGLDQTEQLFRVCLQLLPGDEVTEEDGSQELDVLGTQPEDINRWDGARLLG